MRVTGIGWGGGLAEDFEATFRFFSDGLQLSAAHRDEPKELAHFHRGAFVRRLTASVILYMIIALLAAMIAIRERLPAEFGGSSTGLDVTQDFLYGMGTAISPPLYTLIVQTGLLLLTRRKDHWGLAAVLGMALIGSMTCLGALSEPINLKILNPASFDPIRAVLMTGQILLSIAILVFGVMEWSRRRRQSASTRTIYEH